MHVVVVVGVVVVVVVVVIVVAVLVPTGVTVTTSESLVRASCYTSGTTYSKIHEAPLGGIHVRRMDSF